MSFCDHCQGQRFDRAQVLRALRATRARLRGRHPDAVVDRTIAAAIQAVRELEIPHLEVDDGPVVDGEVVH
jgi:hypothetical protein